VLINSEEPFGKLHSCHPTQKYSVPWRQWMCLHEASLSWLRVGWNCFRITDSKEESPSWEANRFSAGQDVPHMVRNPKVHYCILRSPPSVWARSIQSMPCPSHFLKIHLSIILPFSVFQDLTHISLEYESTTSLWLLNFSCLFANASWYFLESSSRNISWWVKAACA
jgi:hypothetical protein